MRRFPLLLFALLAPVVLGLSVLGPPPPNPTPCRVTARAVPVPGSPGIYRVEFRTVPGCPPGGLAHVRMESGRVYPWREVRPGAVTTSRGVPWYWRAVWRSASGKTYEIPIPGLLAPWERP